jgi:hypothetical protein
VHAFGGNPRHGKHGADRFERGQPQPRLLERLAFDALDRALVLDDPRNGLERFGGTGNIEDRGAKLPDQDRGLARWIIGQDAGGRAVVLDLAAHGGAVGKPHGGN